MSAFVHLSAKYKGPLLKNGFRNKLLSGKPRGIYNLIKSAYRKHENFLASTHL